ncbi:MAG TPA: type IV pilus assembly protein PilM [Acidimicrobiales bacterium]|nr:type IV pilus assembly protein PilM [Acidimicrobiales bacterium]
MAAKSSRRIGLEVSNSAVRIAEVSVAGGRSKLLNLGQVRLPARSVVDGAVVDVAAVASAIERCVKEGGFTIKEVHLGVSGLRAITRELDMPQVPDSELDSAVRLQALDVIPFPADKTLMSARPLEDVTSAEGTPMRRVLLAAAHRDLVEPLLEAVNQAGLTPVSVDLGSSALVRALYDPSVPSSGPEAIVSIGSGLTTIVVHEDGVPHFVRTIAEGGDTITAAIAGALDLPIDDAESTKRNLDQTGPHIRAAAAAAAEAAASLVAEIRSSVEYYSTLPGRRDVRRVTLTGGGSRLAGFAERLQQQSRAEVVIGSALARLDTGALNLGPDDIMRRDALVATVIGLALPDPPGVKSLDLLPPEILVARRERRIERGVLAVAAVVIVALVGLGVVRFLEVHNAENGEAANKAQIASLQGRITQKNRAAREYTAIKADSSAVVPILSTEVYWPAVVADLGKTMPAGGVVTAFSGSYQAPAPVTSTVSPGAVTTTTVPIAEQTPAERENVVIATINVSIATTAGPNYVQSWFQTFLTSPEFRIVSTSPLQHTNKVTTWTATLDVLGTIESNRIGKFEVKAQ